MVANPASDLLELDSGALVPLRSWSAASRRPPGPRRCGSIRPPGCSSDPVPDSERCMRIDVFTIFPDMVGGFAGQQPARPGPARPGCSTCGSTTCAAATHRPAPLGRRHPFGGGRGHGADARAACSPRSRRSIRPGRCCCSAPAAAASTRPAPGSWPARDGFSLLCGRYEGVDERVRHHLVDGELSIGDYVLAGGEVAALVVVEAVGRLVPGVMGNDDVGRRRVVLRRPARVPAVHPAGRASGAGRCPRCCARATTAGSPGGAGPRRCAAPCERRPDLIEARGGLTDDDRRLLDEFDPDA